MRLFLILSIMASSACNMTMESYEDLAEQVRERNRARYQTSLDALRERGFETTHEGSGQVRIDEELRQRCRDAVTERTPLEGVALVATQLEAGSALEVEASTQDICAFFAHRSIVLEGVARGGAENGQPVAMTRTLRPRVRNSEGQTYYLDITFDIISERVVTVDVERPCNLMPMVEPNDPLEFGGREQVSFSPFPTESVAITVEREDLEMVCSENVY